MGLGKEDHQSHTDLSSDFAFGFDNPAFSDRVLKLLIFEDNLDKIKKSNSGSTEQDKLNDLLKSLRQRKVEIPKSDKDYRVKSVNICSLILAAKSPFFYKLFTNGMKSSNQHEVTMLIHSSEEAALLDVLKCMYNKNNVSANTPTTLTEVLVTADKYDVPSCISYCCTRLLLDFPMTAELTLFYIDLPSIVSVDAIKPLINAAEDFLPNILKNISKYRQDIINLSLDGIKLILSRDDLQMNSEDEVYDLVLEWSKKHFPDVEERCSVLKSEIFNIIRLQYLTPQKFQNIFDDFLNGNHLTPDVMSSMRAAILHDTRLSLSRHGRTYKLPPVVVVTFEVPKHQCVVYLDLKREECKDMKIIDSQIFTLDQNVFQLRVIRKEQEKKGFTFGLYLYLKKCRQQPVKVKCEFSVRQNSSPEIFVRQKYVLNHTFEKIDSDWGFANLFDASWDVVIAEDSQFFIDGTLHLRADITLLD